eukprot:3048484-Pyramimonas_sp.AAC.1
MEVRSIAAGRSEASIACSSSSACENGSHRAHIPSIMASGSTYCGPPIKLRGGLKCRLTSARTSVLLEHPVARPKRHQRRSRICMRVSSQDWDSEQRNEDGKPEPATGVYVFRFGNDEHGETQAATEPPATPSKPSANVRPVVTFNPKT